MSKREALRRIGISEETIDWLLDPTAFRQPAPCTTVRIAGVLRIPVEVYSRVVGYFRPVGQWNKGKREEFGERLEYRLGGGRHEPNPYDEIDKRDQKPAVTQYEPGKWGE